MSDFRNRTCGECAWHKKATIRKAYVTTTEYRCINAACRLEGIDIRPKTEACPVFVPISDETATGEAIIQEAKHV